MDGNILNKLDNRKTPSIKHLEFFFWGPIIQELRLLYLNF